MTIDLEPEVATMLGSLAQEGGKTPEQLAQEIFTQRIKAKVALREPQDDWERRLRAIGSNCGVSLSNEALSSEGLYGMIDELSHRYEHSRPLGEYVGFPG